MMARSHHHRAVKRRSLELLSGCAFAALAAALPSMASAQALQATPTLRVGAPVITTGVNSTQVQIRNSETVIDWAPFDTAAAGIIDILPDNNTLSFIEPGGVLGEYAVLNRILPADASGIPTLRAIQFNGDVISRSVNNPGGQIFFYSPTGIIVGPTGTFDVGSLILTTNDIAFIPDAGAPGTGSIFKPGGLLQFFGPAASAGFIDVQAGASIQARGLNAYVALVAPRVTQGGLVQSNGQVAYLAAEQLEMTINGGLFDFRLTVGSEDGNGVVHTGTTTGPASTSAADVQRISMVALPKNDAMTMLLSGSIGYAPAASAAQEGSSIVLAAGFDSDDPTVVPANRDGSITIMDSVFRNPLTAYATNAVAVAPASVATTFENDAAIYAVNQIALIAESGETIDARANLGLRAGQPGAGGLVNLSAFGTGQILVGSGLFVDATSEAADYDKITPYLDGLGGTINLLADGGLIRAALLAQLDASGVGRYGGALGGAGIGGAIDLTLTQNGQIETPELTLLARGDGGNSDNTAGDGFGGAITVLEDQGLLDLGIFNVFAGASGGNQALQNGDGTGGSIDIQILGQAQDWDQLTVDASGATGIAPSTAPAGLAAALPDAVSLLIDGTGSLTVRDFASLSANAFSGYNGPAGFVGQGGGVSVQVTNGGSLAADSFEVYADATYAGDLPAIIPDTTPVQQGGTVSIIADGGSIAARVLTAAANAYGGMATAAAGTATGGTVLVSARNGGTIVVQDPALLTPGTLTVSARAFGEAGFDSADAAGGTARLEALDGSITVLGNATVTASAGLGAFFSVFGGEGHNANGGTAQVEVTTLGGGTGSLSATSLNVLANGDARLTLVGGSGAPGGDPIVGDGGDGTGGTASLTIDAGTLTTGQLLVETAGTGGASAAIDSLTAFQSGNGTGGTSTLTVNGGTSNVGALTLTSLGQGGGGGPAAGGSSLAAFAGDGFGGTSLLSQSGGALTATGTTLDAPGVGGAGMDNSGVGAATDGGAGLAGTAQLLADGALTTGTLTIRSNGTGGNGGVAALGTSGDGGDGTGQLARADIANGAYSLGAVTIQAQGTGGSGVNGGLGIGGSAAFALNDTTGPIGARSLASLFVDSSGFGGPGTAVTGAGTPGQTLLEVNALNPASALAISGDLTLTNLGSVAPAGAGIVATATGAPLVAGGNIAMDTVRDLTISAGPGLGALGSAAFQARSIAATGSLQAGGTMELVSLTGAVAAGNLSAGAWLYVQSATAATLGNLTAGTDVGASAFGGNLTVGNVTAGDEIWLSVFGVDPARVLTAGNLTSTGLGSDAAAGPPVLFGGPGPTGNVIRVRSSGSLNLGAVQTPGRAILVADNGGIAAGQVTGTEAVILLARDNIGITGATTAGKFYVADSAMFLPYLPNAYDPASLDGVAPVDTGGELSVTGTVDAGTVSVATGGNATLAGITASGSVFLRATGGALGVDNLQAGGPVTARARSVSIGSSGTLNFADVDATAGSLTITTAGNLGLVTADASGTVTLSSTGGSIAATGAVNSGGAVSAIGQNGASFTTLISGGTTLLRAPNGAVGVSALTSPGAVTASGRSVTIASPGALTFADLDATAGAATVQTAGNLTLSTADATGALSLRSTGGDLLTTGAVNGGSVALTASGAVQANANVAAAGALAVDAGGTFTLNAVGRGATVSVLSNDIVLGPSAALGARGQTSALTLVNRNPARVTYIGGGANPAGYSLDQTEAAKLFSDGSITIGTALTGPPPPAGQGTVSVGNLAMSFGAAAANNIGTGGELEISTPGRISITGNVALATSSATDTFSLDPTLIELDTSTGSIAMLANGAPLGRLVMTGGTIAIATTNVLPQLSTLTDFAAIKALLDQPGGNPDALRAGTMTFNAAGGLYIQNAGATALYRDRRGFTAGAVAINTGSAATRISVNGQILTAGGPLLGLDTQALVTINGAPAAAGGPFDPASTINGCFIGARCAPPPGSNPPSDSDLNDPVLPGPGGGALFAAPLIELAGTDPLIAPPLVDEPITGVGNDDLWQPRCEDDDEDGACPEADREP